MASRATRRQAIIIGMAEGMTAMMWDQLYSEKERNKTFRSIHEKVKAASIAGYEALKQDTNNELRSGEDKKIRKNIYSLADFIVDFHPMDAISFLLDQVNTQLIHLRPGTQKANTFQQLWYRLKELDRHFDRHQKYEDDAGVKMANFFNKLEM